MVIDRLPDAFLQQMQAAYPMCFHFLEKDISARLSHTVHVLACRCYFSDGDALGTAPRLTACALWQQERRVFAFDADFAALLTQGSADLLAKPDIQLLLKTCDSCFYVSAPDAVARDIDGFFVWLEQKGTREPLLLHFVFLYADMRRSLYATVQLREEQTFLDWCCLLPDNVQLLLDAAYHGDPGATAFLMRDMPDALAPVPALQGMLYRSVQLLLYLGADNAQIEVPSDKAAASSVRRVGTELGERIRSAAANTGTSRKAHTRKGHFHTYWIGSKKDPKERRRVVKWVAPAFVQGSDSTKSLKITVVDATGRRELNGSE